MVVSRACWCWYLQEKAKAVLRRQTKHVMFTEPEVIQAGEPMTVYYNPGDTPLAGSR
jgi:starch synthase